MKGLLGFLTVIAVGLFVAISPANFSVAYAIESASGGQADAPPMVLDSGGPDAYGYYYIDSDDGAFNAPAYNWIDISGYGTDMGVNSDDANVGPFPIGFTFNFYGVDFISFRANSNGWASFSSTVGGFSNQSIPNSAEPNNLLAVFWDDLHPRETGHAYYWSNEVDTCIIAWHDFQRFSGEGDYTFEIILTADGNILYQYQSLTGVLDSHTIGIEDGAGAVGLQYVYNESRDETGTAISFTMEAPDYGYPDVLVIAADDASLFLSDLNGYSDIGAVDYYDPRSGTPSLSELQNYDCAVVWSNYQFADPVGMGDVLADYLDTGGAVVLTEFCFGTGWQLQGRVMSDYSPFTAGQINYSEMSLGEVDAGHQLMRAVGSLSNYFWSNVSVQNSPIMVASYSNGVPLAAYNPDNNLVAINAYVGDDRQFSGDLITLCYNAIIFAAEGPAEILLMQGGTGASMAKADLKGFDDINSVHVYNPAFSAPSLSLLQLYDAVVVWTDFPYNDPALIGNRLADYVDMGGGVVLEMFCFGSGWALQGRIMDSYCPFAPGNTLYETKNLGYFDPDHPLMAGVSNVSDYYIADVSMDNDGELVASWDDSTPFVAYDPDHDVVGVNGFIGDPRQFTGDMMIITHNAINFVRGMTAIDDPIVDLPNQFTLAQNYPNPFNPTTVIEFNIPVKADVRLDIFNVLGQKVTTLVGGVLEAGHHAITFDASEIGSGVYFYRLDAGEFSKTKKMMILK